MRFGLSHPSAARAADRLTIDAPPSADAPQPLPVDLPGRAAPSRLGFADPGDSLEVWCVGDTGGIADPNPQKAVAAAMVADGSGVPLSPHSALDHLFQRAQPIGAGRWPAFVYHLGDVVYYNGQSAQYLPQFFEPYAYVRAPILGVPGNHDGDTSDDPRRSPLDAWTANFCAVTAGEPLADPGVEFGRQRMTQPSCDWTLLARAATIVGLYSNVPSGGYLWQSQRDWLVQEMREARPGVPLLVCLHHPPLSVDAHHGGSAEMLSALDAAFTAAGRWPDAVLSGHVHNYQRLTRRVQGREIPYLVVGNSGYHNRHALAADARPGLDVLGDGSVTFEHGDDAHWGYLKLTVSAGRISGEYVAVLPNAVTGGLPTVTPRADVF